METIQPCFNPGCDKSNRTDLERKLMSCARCKSVKYCGKDCQKAHWKIHKKMPCPARVQTRNLQLYHGNSRPIDTFFLSI